MLKRLSRRRFFGAAAGAAIAPTLAQSTRGLPGPAPPPAVPVGGYTGESAQMGMPDPLYLSRERKRLEAIAGGNLEDHQLDDLERHSSHLHTDAAAANINALRSVSDPVKRLMYAAHGAERYKRSFMDDAARSLRRLLKRGH